MTQMIIYRKPAREEGRKNEGRWREWEGEGPGETCCLGPDSQRVKASR